MGPSTVDGAHARWQGRWVAGLAVRAVMTVVPFVLAVGSIAVGSQLLPRPDGALVIAWYAALCAASWVVLWQSQRILQRLLPLAALLEMSLSFPDRAPSRLGVARRVASARDLQKLLTRPDRSDRPESTQEAAERILVLVSALAGHDRATRGHSERVRAFADLIAARLGLPERDRDRLRWAALLHDIGKLHVPAELLNKAGAPTEEEWQVLRRHPHYGAMVAAPLLDWLEDWGDVIVQHHEKWDGSGYPAGLAGTQICLGARIVAVADAFDVMTAARAYKKPMGRANALRELVDCSGAHFDPDIVRALITTSPRRLLVTMGPLSWLSGLPFVGQAPAAIASALTSQATAATAAIGAMALTGVTAVSPVTLHAWAASDGETANSSVSRSPASSRPGQRHGTGDRPGGASATGPQGSTERGATLRDTSRLGVGGTSGGAGPTGEPTLSAPVPRPTSAPASNADHSGGNSLSSGKTKDGGKTKGNDRHDHPSPGNITSGGSPQASRSPARSTPTVSGRPSTSRPPGSSHPSTKESHDGGPTATDGSDSHSGSGSGTGNGSSSTGNGSGSTGSGGSGSGHQGNSRGD